MHFKLHKRIWERCEIALNPVGEVSVHFSIFFPPTLPWDLSGGLVIGATQLQWGTFCIAVHAHSPGSQPVPSARSVPRSLISPHPVPPAQHAHPCILSLTRSTHAWQHMSTLCTCASLLMLFIFAELLETRPWRGWEVTLTKLATSPSQLRRLRCCQFGLHQRHWLNGSVSDTCHKVLNVCSFHGDGWVSQPGKRWHFMRWGGGRTCCGSLFLPPLAVTGTFLWTYHNMDK